MRSLRLAVPVAFLAGGLTAFAYAREFRLEARASFTTTPAECGIEGEAVSVRYRMYQAIRPLVLEETTTVTGCPDLLPEGRTRVVARPMDDIRSELFSFTAPGQDARVVTGTDAWDLLETTQYSCCALNHVYNYHRLSDGAHMGESHVPAAVLDVRGSSGVLTYVGHDVRRRPRELVADSTLAGILTFTGNDGRATRWALAGAGEDFGRPDSLSFISVAADGTRNSMGPWFQSDSDLSYYGRVHVELFLMNAKVRIPVEPDGLAIKRAELPDGLVLRALP